jgi:hypothetical protein
MKIQSPVYTRTRSREDNKTSTWLLNSETPTLSVHCKYWSSMSSRARWSTSSITYTLWLTDCPGYQHLANIEYSWSENVPNFTSGSSLGYADTSDFSERCMQEFMDIIAGQISGNSSTADIDVESVVKTETISDVEVPGWRSLINAGTVVNNPVTHSKLKAKFEYDAGKASKPEVSTYWTGYAWFNVNITGGGAQSALPYLINTEEKRDEFISDMLTQLIDNTSSLADNAVSDAFGKVNAGSYEYLVELAEGRETIAYLNTVVQRLAKVVKAIKSGKFLSYAPKAYRKYKRLLKKGHNEFSKELLDVMSDAWMEARYAIRPLMISASDAVKLHNEGLKQLNDRITERGQRTQQDRETVRWDVQINDTTVYEYYLVNTFRHEARAGVLIQLNQAFTDMRLLGLTNLASTGWEVIPFSFVLDWFTNIQGLLYSITPNIGVTPLASWVTTKKCHLLQGNVAVVQDGEYIESMSFNIEVDTYLRQVVESPSFINLDINLDIYKLLDLEAIALGFTRKGRAS